MIQAISSTLLDRVIWCLVAVAALLAVVVAVIYYVFDPMQYSLFPKCGFLVATGYKCPGCGGQRMLHALLHGDIVGAFRYNAYAMIVFPLLGCLMVVEHFRNRVPRLYLNLSSIGVGIAFIGGTLLWWWLRNVYGW